MTVPAGVAIAPHQYVRAYADARDDIADRTAAVTGDRSGAELIATIRAHPSLTDAIADLDARTVIAGARGPITAQDWISTRLLDVTIHTDDLSRSLPDRDPAPITRDAMAAVTRLLAQILAGQSPGRSVEVRVPPYRGGAGDRGAPPHPGHSAEHGRDRSVDLAAAGHRTPRLGGRGGLGCGPRERRAGRSRELPARPVVTLVRRRCGSPPRLEDVARADGKLTHDLLDTDKGPQDACGIFGVWAPGEEVAKLTYFGLYALQHRGQEAAGIAVSDGSSIVVFKDLGLVSQVFDESTLAALTGHIAVGHTRYSTTGSSTWENAQPSFRTTPTGTGIALGHNGNLVNTAELAEQAIQAGVVAGSINATTDSDLLTALLAARPDVSVEQAAMEVLPQDLGRVLAGLHG